MVKSHKHYNIVACANGCKALDGNVEACHDKTYPRPFLWDPVHHAANHQWQFRHVEGEWYMIVNKANGKALDGNCAVPQVSAQHPAPFLWEATPHSHNHHWRLTKVGKKTYMIVNRACGKALDSNYHSYAQMHPSHPTPLMWEPTPHSHNHHWKLLKAH